MRHYLIENIISAIKKFLISKLLKKSLSTVNMKFFMDNLSMTLYFQLLIKSFKKRSHFALKMPECSLSHATRHFN